MLKKSYWIIMILCLALVCAAIYLYKPLKINYYTYRNDWSGALKVIDQTMEQTKNEWYKQKLFLIKENIYISMALAAEIVYTNSWKQDNLDDRIISEKYKKVYELSVQECRQNLDELYNLSNKKYKIGILSKRAFRDMWYDYHVELTPAKADIWFRQLVPLFLQQSLMFGSGAAMGPDWLVYAFGSYGEKNYEWFQKILEDGEL